MTNKFLKSLICVLTVCVLLISSTSVLADTTSVNTAEKNIQNIISFKLNEVGAANIQDWIDTSLTKNAGTTSEWYVVALSQNGNYNFNSYESALIKYLENNEIHSATSREKYALSLIAAGSTNQYIQTVLNNSIGKQGIMSWIFGLHLLNNGYTSNDYSVASVKTQIVSMQLSDGGWAVTGSRSDVDVTAMAVQALAPYYSKDSNIKKSIDKALSLLSSKQLSDGDYSSYGVSNPESTAQVIVALSSLNIDFESDSRFIKNKNTLLDGLLKYQLNNGSFCHKVDGNYNNTSTVQAFYSLVSYLRMSNGKSPFYILDAKNPSAFITTTAKNAANNDEQPARIDNTKQGKNNKTPKKSNAKADKIKKAKSVYENEKIETSTTVEKQKSTKNTEKTEKRENESNTSVTSISNAQIQNNTAENQAEKQKTAQTSDYKLWSILIIGIVTVIVCAILYFTKKLNKENLIAIIIAAVIAIGFITATNFQSVESYYSSQNSSKKDPIGTVTLSISCDTIVGKGESKYIPSNGLILQTTDFQIEEGDTVFDILSEAAAKNKIQIESNDTADDSSSIYIEGINHIYEFDFGELSGWIYFVNGETPSVSCGEYKLSDGDIIEWKYTCNLGEDLK